MIPTLYEFESQSVRVVADDTGAPWFNAKDVCNVLGFGNARQALDTHVDAEDVQKLDTLTPGGRQRQNHINESGLYALILGSIKPEAKRFKRWVTTEVLPAIRQTGSYAATNAVTALPMPTQDKVSALLLIGEAVAKVPGVRSGIAMAATLTAIHENTGITLEALRKALPAANEPISALNPTQLGERLGWSARAVNSRLRDQGLQFRNERDEWQLTEAGCAYGEAHPYSRNGHSGYQILWRAEVTDLLKEVA
ncbi:BRO family protein [Propionivibrio sp.]|uniref:BRO-N domain-containing protein n=1 Tax=Propionivibrio sp. TaxID=2212460 RepID=UPI00260D562E|nr:BRO family protein [Propionivibrio sp.]